MEATVKSLIAQPSWAYDLCYYFLAVAVIAAVYGVYIIFQVLAVPGLVKRLIPTAGIIIALVLSTSISIVLAMMQFWVCRGALAPARSASAEKFAVKCGNDVDCQAVGGMPQRPTCACGGRGICGGCVMQNNMEPQSSFAAEFGPFEGFRNARTRR
jgi:hypothetical protein